MNDQLTRIDSFRERWKSFLILGILLMMLGGGIIASSYNTSIFSIIILGLFLIGGGMIQIMQSILARKWNGLFLSLFLGLFYIITGFMCITKPATAAITITFWISAFFFMVGLFKVLAALILRFDRWKWVFFNGAITFLLGMMIYADWPLSGLWVMALFIGVDLILAGWTWVLLALSARKEMRME
ncbi:MAG: HdeD family acid-resistance protein [Parachlamydiaceae bacterium]